MIFIIQHAKLSCPWGRTSRIFIYGGMCDRSVRSGTKLAREIQLTDWSTAGNLSNRSSRVQIPRDICTRFGRYLYSTKCSWIINSNSWMRLSRISRILQINEGAIHRGRRPSWITPSEICGVLHILRKPNSIIALLFIQNISPFDFIASIFGQQQLVMVKYACGFNQS